MMRNRISVRLQRCIGVVVGAEALVLGIFAGSTPAATPAVSFAAAKEFAVGSRPGSVAIADLNGDGRRDVVTANGGNTGLRDVSVLLGRGDGTFEPQARFATGAPNAPSSVAIGDLNRDGAPDLVTANTASGGVSVLLGNGDGSFRAPVLFAAGVNPISVAIADLNGDGRPDVVSADAQSRSVSVLLGRGDGSLQPEMRFAAGFSQAEVAIGDLNGDGRPDLVIANIQAAESPTPNTPGDVSVLLGNGDGTFQPQTRLAADAPPVSVAIGDLNTDGRPDVATTNIGFGVVYVGLLFGNGDGSFRAPVRLARRYRSGLGSNR